MTMISPLNDPASLRDDEPIRLVPTDRPRVWSARAGGDGKLRVTAPVLAEIRATIGARPAETGGMLGGSRLDGVVRAYHFDRAGRASSVTYSPDHERLSALLAEEWNPAGVNLLGFAHSHPGLGIHAPSHGDISYAGRFLDTVEDLDELLLPIATPGGQRGPSAQFALRGYAAQRAPGRAAIEPLDLEVVDDLPWAEPADHPAFSRVVEAYDLHRMARSRIVLVGTGGAAGFAEDMCRAGIGEAVLIDPDVVEESNTATQSVSLHDVGRAKVDALADRLVSISPTVVVVTVQRSLDDLSDRDVGRLTGARVEGRPTPEATLLGGFTDDFWAQARTARLALNLGVPAIAAQVYAQGRGVEVTFALRGVTPACQRCVLGSRYRAVLSGHVEAVGSAGTPIFATTRLNALKTMVALALLHGAGDRPAAGPGAARWLALLDRIANRNLIMARLDPDIGTTLGLAVFDKALAGADQQRLVADETLWLPQEPESPATGFEPCGDCRGGGDLDAVVGTIAESRLARPARLPRSRPSVKAAR